MTVKDCKKGLAICLRIAMGNRRSFRCAALAIVLLVPSIYSYSEDLTPASLREDSPGRYVVLRKDNLWDISKRFLKDPWRWPDLWGMNKEEIRNPHLIYPGNVLVLERNGNRVRLRLVDDGTNGILDEAKGTAIGSTLKLRPKVRPEASTGAAVSSIRSSVIEPFLSRPLIVASDQFDHAPRVAATGEGRVLAGPGDNVYVSGLPADGAPIWQAYREGNILFDPVTGELLGHEVVYLGDLQVRQHGAPATMQIVKANSEIGVGDRVIDAPANEILAYVPRSAESTLQGLVVSAPPNTISEIGQNQTVVLNVGSRNGVEIGHVFALYRAGRVVQSRKLPSSISNESSRRELRSLYSQREKEDRKPVVTPDERYGVVFVYKTFEKVSYALVMSTTRPVNLLDIVKAP